MLRRIPVGGQRQRDRERWRRPAQDHAQQQVLAKLWTPMSQAVNKPAITTGCVRMPVKRGRHWPPAAVAEAAEPRPPAPASPPSGPYGPAPDVAPGAIIPPSGPSSTQTMKLKSKYRNAGNQRGQMARLEERALHRMARWAAGGCRMRTAIGPRVEARKNAGPPLKPRRQFNQNRSCSWHRRTGLFASAKFRLDRRKAKIMNNYWGKTALGIFFAQSLCSAPI